MCRLLHLSNTCALELLFRVVWITVGAEWELLKAHLVLQVLATFIVRDLLLLHDYQCWKLQWLDSAKEDVDLQRGQTE